MYWDYNYILGDVSTLTISDMPTQLYSYEGRATSTGAPTIEEDGIVLPITCAPLMIGETAEEYEERCGIPYPYENGDNNGVITDEKKWYEKREVIIGGISLVVLIIGAFLLPKRK